jgi:transposase
MAKPKPYSRAQFEAQFHSEDACLDALFTLRFGKLTCCPNCGVIAAEFYRVAGRRCFACVHCRHQLHPTAGTVMHKSTTPLRYWFLLFYQFSISKNGISAKEIQRDLGVTYKCAWRLAKQVRSVMQPDKKPLKGIVEADEAYIGGRRRSSNRFSNKTPLLGVVERKGRVRVMVSDVASTKRVTDFLVANVLAGSVLNTDESLLYNRAANIYKRQTVKHGGFEFVRKDVHSNTIEGFWGNFKPYLDGTHRSVSKQHLQLYVNEAVWKYNHRQEPHLFHLLLAAAAQPVPKAQRRGVGVS